MRVKVGDREVDVLVVIGACMALVVVVLLLLIVLLPRRNADPVETMGQSIGDLYDWVAPDLLYVPDELSSGMEPSWSSYRERREVWSADEVAEHWIDPLEIGVDLLEETVDEEIRKLLEAFP